MRIINMLILKLKSLIMKDTTYIAVDKNNETVIKFKNGSIIKALPIKETETIRGRRRTIPCYDDFECDQKILDEVLSKYTKSE